jgi:hypothetical protein
MKPSCKVLFESMVSLEALGALGAYECSKGITLHDVQINAK